MQHADMKRKEKLDIVLRDGRVGRWVVGVGVGGGCINSWGINT